jgi:hypothetical protein
MKRPPRIRTLQTSERVLRTAAAQGQNIAELIPPGSDTAVRISALVLQEILGRIGIK